MQIWVGLGNPGTKYALQRHNVGFMAADILGEVHDFGPWQKKFRSLIAEGRIGRQRVLLLKPQTFMNDSGDAVQQALNFYKLDLDALTGARGGDSVARTVKPRELPWRASRDGGRRQLR